MRVWRVNARAASSSMLTNVEQTAQGAGGSGWRERRNAPVPVAIRIHRRAGPNSELGRAGVKPLNPAGRSRGKRGFPAPLLPPEGSSA